MRIRRCLQTCLLGSIGLVVASAAQGCSDETATTESEIKTAKPHVLALSTYSASLGTPVDVFIANPPPATARKMELVFEGVFKRGDGKEEKVAMTQPAQRTEAGAIRWTTLGPFLNPFSPKDADIGTFEGKVGVKTTLEDGTETMDDSPLPVKFEVKPSILITELQPVEAACDKPALRLIGQMSYKMKATTIGFKATSITYQIKIPNTVPDVSGRPVLATDGEGTPQYRTTQLVLDPNVEVKDEDAKAFTLPPVPESVPSYGVVFAVIAQDAEGKKITSTFGMTAHRPIDLFYDGRFQLAQVYPPKPVSACIPGGQQGRSVDYSESQSETRQRSLSITLSKNFTKGEENNWSTSDGKTVSTSKTEQDGYSKSNTKSNSFTFERNHSDTTGVAYTASSSFTKGVNGKVSFSPFKIFGGAEVGGNAEWSNSNSTTNSRSSTNGWSQSNTTSNSETNETNHSTATTDSTSVTKTDSKGGNATTSNSNGEAEGDSWTVSSSQSIQRGFSGQVIANTYGVFYRQMARYTYKAFVMSYNMCGEGEIIGDVTQQDYIWAPDLALSNQCPPLPKSNLPPAQCNLPPCDPY